MSLPESRALLLAVAVLAVAVLAAALAAAAVGAGCSEPKDGASASADRRDSTGEGGSDSTAAVAFTDVADEAGLGGFRHATGGAFGKKWFPEGEEKLLEGEEKLLGKGYVALQAESHPTDFRTVEILKLAGCTDPQASNYKSHYVATADSTCEY